MKLDNLTGRRFGMLVVTHRWSEIGEAAKWRCVCDCGATTVAAAHHLKAGTTNSCGCKRLKKALDLIGQQFSRLTVIARASNKGSGTHTKAQWQCRCECGNTCIVPGYSLKSGNTKSCGCLRRESNIRQGKLLNFKHGMTGTRVHNIWLSMLQRCTDPSHKSYEVYGGRGIIVCDRWKDFENFLADMGVPGPELTIDRIDNERGYEPGNCRWATATEQANNRRDNFKIRAFGQNLTLAAWARVTGLSKAAIMYRLATGKPPEEALSEPPKKNGSKLREFVPPAAA